jgi:hypothetical protein
MAIAWRNRIVGGGEELAGQLAANPGNFRIHPKNQQQALAGSGTTIIACERLSRKCRAIEISPGYCAVAIERWATATGKTPELLHDSTP